MTTPPRETILIVDDQEESRFIVCTVLSMMGYDAVAVGSAEEAFTHLYSSTPDLILLDVIMPGTDGIAACCKIKSDERLADIPIIFLSAADDKKLIVEALEVGAVDYVTKPFDRAELVSRIRTQLALKQARDQLRVLAEDKDEILGILAHDLKNNLAGMRLSAGVLHSGATQLPGRCVPLVENIVNATNRMLVFVEEFLTNQRAEQISIKKDTVNLVELVVSLAREHRPAAQAKDIALNVRVPKTAILVHADPEALTQALENLVSNAIKFTQPGGRVGLRVKQSKSGVVQCFVCDTGPGFTPEDRKKMFRRYGRLSAQPTGNEFSTGLGLSIAKRLLNAMGGSIALNDGKTEGSEFVVTLPTMDGASVRRPKAG